MNKKQLHDLRKDLQIIVHGKDDVGIAFDAPHIPQAFCKSAPEDDAQLKK